MAKVPKLLEKTYKYLIYSPLTEFHSAILNDTAVVTWITLKGI